MSNFKKVLLMFYLVAILGFFLFEFFEDFYASDHFFPHPNDYIELSILLMTVIGLVYFLSYFRQQSLAKTELTRSLENVHLQLQHASERLKAGKASFLELVEWQFDEWGLTKSEKQIGMLILKGLSFEDISNIRETSSKTVRKQASAIYAKSKLEGRNEFSAWFFEDLLG